jgi:excisionase family DNA binding protein
MVIKSNRLLTLEEAAYFLNLSPRTLYRKIHDNELAALKVGSLWRLEPDEVMNYAHKRHNRNTAWLITLYSNHGRFVTEDSMG